MEQCVDSRQTSLVTIVVLIFVVYLSEEAIHKTYKCAGIMKPRKGSLRTRVGGRESTQETGTQKDRVTHHCVAACSSESVWIFKRSQLSFFFGVRWGNWIEFSFFHNSVLAPNLAVPCRQSRILLRFCRQEELGGVGRHFLICKCVWTNGSDEIRLDWWD